MTDLDTLLHRHAPDTPAPDLAAVRSASRRRRATRHVAAGVAMVAGLALAVPMTAAWLDDAPTDVVVDPSPAEPTPAPTATSAPGEDDATPSTAAAAATFDPAAGVPVLPAGFGLVVAGPEGVTFLDGLDPATGWLAEGWTLDADVPLVDDVAVLRSPAGERWLVDPATGTGMPLPDDLVVASERPVPIDACELLRKQDDVVWLSCHETVEEGRDAIARVIRGRDERATSAADGGFEDADAPSPFVKEAEVARLEGRAGRFTGMFLDGDVALLQHSGECEVPTVHLADGDGGLQPLWETEDGTQGEAFALGFLPDGRALVQVLEAACGEQVVAPGLWAVEPGSLDAERLGDAVPGAVGTWGTSDRILSDVGAIVSVSQEGDDPTLVVGVDLRALLTGERAAEAAFEAGEIASVDEGAPNDVFVRDLGRQQTWRVPPSSPVLLDPVLVAPSVTDDDGRVEAETFTFALFGPDAPVWRGSGLVQVTALDGRTLGVRQLYLP